MNCFPAINEHECRWIRKSVKSQQKLLYPEDGVIMFLWNAGKYLPVKFNLNCYNIRIFQHTKLAGTEVVYKVVDVDSVCIFKCRRISTVHCHIMIPEHCHRPWKLHYVKFWCVDITHTFAYTYGSLIHHTATEDIGYEVI